MTEIYTKYLDIHCVQIAKCLILKQVTLIKHLLKGSIEISLLAVHSAAVPDLENCLYYFEILIKVCIFVCNENLFVNRSGT